MTEVAATPDPNALPTHAEAERRYTRIAWAIIGVGALFRFVSWNANVSFFIDEAMVMLNVIERDFAGLLEELSYNQAAPPFFLWLEKLALLAAGDSERVLRFVPFVASLVGLPLFHRLARRWLAPQAALIALAAFASALPLIYFAAEAKPYSGDVLVTIVTLLFAEVAQRRGLRGSVAAGFAVWGAVALWLSYPAVIVLVGVGLVRILPPLVRRDFGAVLRESPVYLVWVTSLGLHYFLSLQEAGSDPFFKDHFASFRLPLPPTSFWELRQLSTAFFRAFNTVLGYPYPGIAGLAFVLGWMALMRRNPHAVALISAPLGIAWMLSNLEVYPFEGRLILYLAPILAVGVGAGAWDLVERTWASTRVVAIVFVTLLLALPLELAYGRLHTPRQREESRPVLEDVAERIEPEDTVYVYYGAQYAYRYYSDRLGLPDEITLDPFVIAPSGTRVREPVPAETRTLLGPSGRRDWHVYIDDLDRLGGRGRVWFVFSHVWVLLGINEQELVLFHLDRTGAERLDEIRGLGAAAFLYDLAPEEGSL